MACLCVPEAEYDELLEHVPLSVRRKSLISSPAAFENQDESSNGTGLLSVLPCSAGDQMNQHMPQEQSPNCKVSADEHSLDSGTAGQGSLYVNSCQDVSLPINGDSQGSQEDMLTGDKANGDASGLDKFNVDVPLSPNPVQSNVSEIFKVDCVDKMPLSLSKNVTCCSASTGIMASCKDLGLPSNGNSQRSQVDKLTGTKANADVSRLEKVNFGITIPPVPSNIYQITKVKCADKILPSLSKDDTRSSANAIVPASCQDVGLPLDCNSQGSQADRLTGTEVNADATVPEKVDFGGHLPPNPVPSTVPDIKNADCSDKMLLSLPKDDADSSSSTGLIVVNTMDNKLSDFTFDELDHIVLKDRRKLLLKRKLVELEKHALKGSSVGLAEDVIAQSAGRIKEEPQPNAGEFMTDQNQLNGISMRNVSDLSSTFTIGTKATGTGNGMEEKNLVSHSERPTMELMSRDDEDDSVPTRTNDVYRSTLNTSLKVKAEPLDYNSLQNPERRSWGNIELVKHEEDIYDGIDHMLLRDRIKLLTSVEDFELNSGRNSECLKKMEPGAFKVTPIISDAKPIRVQYQRKRKKTATDSIETALEEDAPGLLKVLLDQGVSVDEIKLYGESESDDLIDESFNENSFSELEAVMTKISFQRSSLMKFAPIRCTKGSKPSYCLACLFSLVEQTRYLQFRRWPVEWGWCRDLQSFIFVFKKHHRIVLERPEYGYATYFFQLVDSLPIDWQVKRLVTAMKLTSCGRITLIENKPLSVGEDLTEGEAKVLMEFGWLPNTGLGTMLNYCDRVVHDRKNESDSSEWRSKIGKLLVDGYNSGTIVSTSVVENMIENKDGEIT